MKPWWQKALGRRVQFALDLIALSAAFGLAVLLRFEFAPSVAQIRTALIQWPYVVLLQFAALFFFGVYTFIWRYVGMAEVGAFLKAGGAAMAMLVAVRLAAPDHFKDLRVPLSIIGIDTVLAFGGVLALRVVRRALYERFEKERRLPSDPDQPRKAVLLVGAGQAGVLAAREILAHGGAELEVKGFLDDDSLKRGAVINGIKVLGTTEDLPRLARELDLDHVIITIAHASREEIGAIVRKCEQCALKARIIPDLFQLLGGHLEVNQIRDVAIEDLLGREAVKLNEEEVGRFITGKTVMVTGAGGSIGSEMARQVARLNPSRLLLVERAEFVLFTIHKEISELWPELDVVPLVADIGDEPRMRALFAAYRPQVVFHAAAHKHVPMMETNPTEAVKNNILGTRCVARLAGEHGVDAFVMISTDKAVRPTSVMGASKRVAEMVVQACSGSASTRYVAVRFGNVLGSAGSVIPVFREQIARGGPVKVTHPEMRRYFMTIPEAAQLVMQAGAMGEGGEIFVLDMGEPVRILDLAQEMIRLSGFEPGKDIQIAFSGIRPGEKLFEELETDEEHMAKTRHSKIFVGKIASYPEAFVERSLEALTALVAAGDDEALKRQLLDLVREENLREEASAGKG